MSVLVAIALLGAAAAALAVVLRGPVALRVPHRRDLPSGSPERLVADVERLAVDLHPRSYRDRGNLEAAASFIEREMRAAGLSVEVQDYTLVEGTFRNVVASRRGEPGADLVIVGAHYDAYFDTPGADDNASGVAVLLELARTLPKEPAARDLQLVAWSTEEPPFFGTEDMGSARHAPAGAEAGHLRRCPSVRLPATYHGVRLSRRPSAAWHLTDLRSPQTAACVRQVLRRTGRPRAESCVSSEWNRTP